MPEWMQKMLADLGARVEEARAKKDEAEAIAEAARRPATRAGQQWDHLRETLIDLQRAAEWFKTGDQP